VQKLRLHAAEAGGVFGAFVRWVVQKLSLHAAEPGGVSGRAVVRWVVQKLRLHAAEAGGVLTPGGPLDAGKFRNADQIAGDRTLVPLSTTRSMATATRTPFPATQKLHRDLPT
jgi:hypothetical protein